jgi:hypothetical protein
MTVKLEDGEYGRRAVITSSWTTETTRDVIAQNAAELELNYAKGWRGHDLDFLQELPQLQAFNIIDWQIPSVEPIHFLRELRSLHVSTLCKSAVRFGEFPCLEDCGLEWRPRCESLFSCTSLKKLFLNRYKKRDADAFSSLVNLESLAILTAPVGNLVGLRPLKRLRSLRLGNLRRLSSLAGIEELSALEELKIDTCRSIGSIDELRPLAKLRKLSIDNCGEIESLKPLELLSGLELVVFVESTNVRDGDLSPLLNKKNLSRVSFQNRRHYSHRREDFAAAYFGEEYMRQMKAGEKRLSNRELVEKALTTSSKPFWQRISWR